MTNSCSKSRSQGSIVVPITKDIPFYNARHIPVNQKISFSQMPDKPRELVDLYRFLQNPSGFTLRKLHVITSVRQIISLGNGRLLMLDAQNNHLFEYNLKTDSTVDVANMGRGPGELTFSKEMVKRGKTVYIAQGMQISRFACGTNPCTYKGTTDLKFIPYSITVAGDSLAVLGTMMIRSNKLKLGNKLSNLKSVHVLKINGNEIGEFGNTYKTNGQWMLLQPFVSEGIVRYIPYKNLFMVAYKRIPVIYLYNHNFKLWHTYRINKFILGEQKYNTKIGMLSIVKGDYSRIEDISVINQDEALIETVTYKNWHVADRHYVWDRKHNFYVMNFKDGKNYYLGGFKLKASEPSEKILVTREGLALYEKGDLYWVMQ